MIDPSDIFEDDFTYGLEPHMAEQLATMSYADLSEMYDEERLLIMRWVSGIEQRELPQPGVDETVHLINWYRKLMYDYTMLRSVLQGRAHIDILEPGQASFAISARGRQTLGDDELIGVTLED